MKEEFKEKVAIVTGAASGIGRAAALAFAEKGAKVVVADVSVEGGEEVVQLINNDFSQAVFMKTDVSKRGEVEAMVKKAIDEYGRLDFAFNNAGIEGPSAHTAEYQEKDFDKLIGINLKGVWLCMKYEIPAMLKQSGGAIVNNASVAGLVGFEAIGPYTASKHGVLGLTKASALEYASKNIRINAVCPGVILTPMVERYFKGGEETEKQLLLSEPIGRFGRPEEIADAVIWLCSDKASFVIGHPLVVDGGMVAR